MVFRFRSWSFFFNLSLLTRLSFLTAPSLPLSLSLSLTLANSYPIEPPRVRFVTPVLHPNIDGGGRVCLDTLSLPPKGSWRPSLSLGAALGAVRALLAEPNGDDGLVEEVAHEFRHARAAFDARARAMTRRHASGGGGGGAGGRREEAAARGAAEEAKEGQVEEKENKVSSSPAASEKHASDAAAAAPASAAPVSRLQLGAKRAREAGKEDE